MAYSNNMKHYLSLDIIRGLTSFSVLLSHWGAWTTSFADITTQKIITLYQITFQFLFWAGGGIHPGVIIFIVLSGFCIHLPQAMEPEKLKRKGFWLIFFLRRSSRIMPVFWIALSLGLISSWLTGSVHTDESSKVLNGEVFFSIFGIAEIARFFGATSLYPGNEPLSSVAVEILLYASYPFLLFIHKRHGMTALMGFGLLMYSIIVLARLLGVESFRMHGTWFELVIYWIIGVVSAEVFAKLSVNNNIVLTKLALLVAVGYLCYWALITFVLIKGFHVVTTLLFALLTGAGIISLLTLENKPRQRPNWVAAALALLGKRSYSLYVVHTPVIFITLGPLTDHTKIPIFANPWIALMAVFIATELLFKFVEQPAHQYAKHWR
jgi:peptidoglycan/LPS O-acetylase OafA/YrhL